MECPIHKLPVFIKGGALLPMKKVGKNTQAETTDLFLHCYQGESGAFTFYEDDGESFDYQKGVHAQRAIQFNGHQLTLGTTEGTYASPYKNLTVVLHGFPKVSQVQWKGQSYAVSESEFSFFTPLEKYDPINDPEWMGAETIQRCTLPYDRQAMDIQILI